MKYEVRKGGKVYYSTESPACRYSPEREREIQNAGYEVYLDGKKIGKGRKK